MSRVLLYILLFVLNASVVDDSSLQKHCACVESASISECDYNVTLPQTSADCDYDTLQGAMLLSRTTARYVVETSGGVSVLPSFRYSRANSSERVLLAAISSRHAGRITKIFEYNHFRSILRVVYYLHTLCRLRI